MEFLAIAVFLVVSALVLALLSGHPIAWLKREWHLMRAHYWSPYEITGPKGTEDGVQRLELKQRALAKQMRRQGRHLFASKKARRKAYTPVGTTPIAAPEIPPARKPNSTVVPMRRRTGT